MRKEVRNQMQTLRLLTPSRSCKKEAQGEKKTETTSASLYRNIWDYGAPTAHKHYPQQKNHAGKGMPHKMQIKALHRIISRKFRVHKRPLERHRKAARQSQKKNHNPPIQIIRRSAERRVGESQEDLAEGLAKNCRYTRGEEQARSKRGDSKTTMWPFGTIAGVAPPTSNLLEQQWLDSLLKQEPLKPQASHFASPRYACTSLT